PNEMIATIFHGVHMPKRIQLRGLSSRVLAIIDQMPPTITTLYLFGSQSDVLKYCNQLGDKPPDDIQYWDLHRLNPAKSADLIINREHLGADLIAKLARLFPNLKKLVVCFNENEYFEQLVPQLLEAQSETLHSLSILGEYRPGK